MTTPREFWDDVFVRGRSDFVADHPPQYFFDILNLAGPFQEKFGLADQVLDVGPGFGRLLQAHTQIPAKRYNFAIELSEVNAKRLAEEKIADVFPPGSHGLDGFNIDLAWSVSCFPHCDYNTQVTLIEQVWRALRPGGEFYLEHVDIKPGAADCAEEYRMAVGRYHVSPPGVVSAGYEGFHVEKIVTREIGSDLVYGWVARLVRP